MDEKKLLALIKKSGWKEVPEGQMRGLLSKVNLLEATGRYRRLVRNLEMVNDKDNFKATGLEATVAFQFESRGIELEYEVKQDPDGTGSIDFRWGTKSGKLVYIELRLLQQDKVTSDSIKRQLQAGNMYGIIKDGDSETQDIIRIQRAVLEKVQKRDGTPTKFITMHKNAINIVAVDVSQIIMGMVDSQDCKLVTLGDPSVKPIYRRGIFGLFQESMPQDSGYIQSLAKSYEHIRKTLHGVLFLFRKPTGEPFNYSIERFLAWNPRLTSEDSAKAICSEIEPALPLAKGSKLRQC